MSGTMSHRGPDQSGVYGYGASSLAHNRLSIIDLENGIQPMTAVVRGSRYTIVYNGELYNTDELRGELARLGHEFRTRCDTEVLLHCYIEWKHECPSRLNGIFAFAVLDEDADQLFVCRDRFGIKPFYYTVSKGRFMFASEIKALLAHPDVTPEVSREGLWELLFLTPVTLIGSSVFKDIYSLEPAHCGIWQESVLHKWAYWELSAKPFEGNEETAVRETRDILSDAIRRQLVSDVPLCTFLSGGLDSSVVTAVAAKQYQEEGRQLHTYSFEYENNGDYFRKSLFQPQSDDEYAAWLARELGTSHHILTISPKQTADALCDAALLRDFPGQADIDSSLLLYCKMVKQTHTVALSGECSDEIFGGYPWFYRSEMLEKPFFPWIHDARVRANLFRKDVAKAEDGYAYLSQKYREDLARCPLLPDDSDMMKQSRMATWLSTRYFMASLLERKDRMSMGASLEVRVPFSDHRLLEYVYNVPWEIKRKNDVEKYLLREAMGDYLPERIKNRKKSPYPKVLDPEYERIVTARLDAILADKKSRLHEIIDRAALDAMLTGGDKTWFGQLMARPQLVAWLLQMEGWMKQYNIEFV
jgi:asparagine synthase (glutamine-hydrolysing)